MHNPVLVTATGDLEPAPDALRPKRFRVKYRLWVGAEAVAF